MPLTTGMVVVFALAGLLGVLFVTEAVPVEIAALTVPVALAALSPWTAVAPEETIAGFASPATVTVLAMFVLSEGVRRTGVVGRLGAWTASVTGDDERRQLLATVGLSGPVAGVVNNTPVVAVLVPLVTDLARDGGTSPSKLLMPLSFASMLGGTLTLVGTSTNLLASDLSDRLLAHPIGMFEFTRLGVLVLLAGTIYLLTVGRVLLPERVRPEMDLVERFRLGDYLGRVRVAPDSSLVGRPVGEAIADVDLPLDVLQLRGEDRRVTGPFSDQPVEAGDVLTVRADPETRRAFADRPGAEPLAGEPVADADLVTENHTLVELTVTSDSALVGETVETRAFRTRYRATLLGVVRGDEAFRDRLDGVVFEAGDSLLVQVSRDDVPFLREAPAFIVSADAARGTPATDEEWFRTLVDVEEVRDVIDAGGLRGIVDAAGLRRALEDAGAGHRATRPEKLPVAAGTLLGVVGLAALGVLPVYVLALAGIVVMVTTGCVRTREAYEAVNWSVIFLLAGVIPLGVAMDRTGAAAYLASEVTAAGDVLSPVAVLGLFYLLTAALASVVTPAATVVVTIPVAVDVAARLGANEFSFLLATTFGATTALVTPVGYQTNLMVYSPGGYRFADYLRVGGPLQLLLAVVVTGGIVLFWGV